MVKIPAKVTNERREKVWFLMLKGYNPQSLSKALNVSHVTIYNDIKFLTKKSKQYVFDLAKGTHTVDVPTGYRRYFVDIIRSMEQIL